MITGMTLVAPGMTTGPCQAAATLLAASNAPAAADAQAAAVEGQGQLPTVSLDTSSRAAPK